MLRAKFRQSSPSYHSESLATSEPAVGYDEQWKENSHAECHQTDIHIGRLLYFGLGSRILEVCEGRRKQQTLACSLLAALSGRSFVPVDKARLRRNLRHPLLPLHHYHTTVAFTSIHFLLPFIASSVDPFTTLFNLRRLLGQRRYPTYTASYTSQFIALPALSLFLCKKDKARDISTTASTLPPSETLASAIPHRPSIIIPSLLSYLSHSLIHQAVSSVDRC